MLCPSCRRRVERGASACGSCSAPLHGGGGSLELVLADGTRMPLAGAVTIGRAPGNTLRLDDPSVSRWHARIVAGEEGVTIEDAGASFGVAVSGRRVVGSVALWDGAEIRLGDSRLGVERRREEHDAARTIVVRPGESLVVPAAGASRLDESGTSYGFRPRLRSGWAFKRLEATEGEHRFLLKDFHSGKLLRMGADEAVLFELLRRRSSLPELIAESELQFGADGPARLARLLAELGARGFLAGVEEEEAPAAAPGRLERLLRPRELATTDAARPVDRVYVDGGFVLFTRPALLALAIIALVGLAAFAYLVAARDDTPFVVAESIPLGGLVFLLGRLLVAGLHELAHALTLASYGRQLGRAGLRLLVFVPFVFVDTSDAWFEPRRHRLAVSAAGPVSDLVLGGAFSLVALTLEGTLREVFFQLAFAAYVGALFNLNPLLDRDGYYMLVDVLRCPGLRRRAREQLAHRLAGKPLEGDDSRSVRLYGAAAFAWSILSIGFVILLTTRYYDRLTALASPEVVWAVLGAFYLLLLVPVALTAVRPLLERRRRDAATEPDVPA